MSTDQTDRPRTRRAAALPLGLLLAALVALLGAGLGPASASASATSAEPAWLRPAHLVPDLGAMDIRLSPFSGEGTWTGPEDDPLLETTAAYGAVGEYSQLPAGSYAVSVRPEGTPVSEPPLLSLTFDLEPGQAYTVAGLGTKDEPRLERLVDDLTPPGDGTASVRLLPASLAAPSVDVRAEDGPVLAAGAALGTPTGYTSAPAGPWTITASGAGADASAATGESDVVLDSNSVYTLLVLDAEDGSLVVEPVVDAVGTGLTPVGGAATGFGGLVDDRATAPVAWWAAGALLVFGVLLLAVRAQQATRVRADRGPARRHARR